MSILLKPKIDLSEYVKKKNSYVVEIDLGSDEQKEENVEEELVAEELAEEELIEEDDVNEERRKLFVDTPEDTVDEETQAETNRIGEKGSIARDRYEGENEINDQPRLESETVFPGELPDEFAAAVTQESGLPIGVNLSELVDDAAEEAVESLVEEGAVAVLSEVDESEELLNNEVEVLDEVEDESVVQEEEAVDVEEIISSVLESDIVVLESESVESDDTDTDVVEEEIEETTDPAEEYTKTASIPKTLMKEIVEGGIESIANKVQKRDKTSEPIVNNVPTGDDALFFEDKISNASVTGAESFNVKKDEYAPYYKHIKDKIRLYWLLQYGTDASINQVTKGYKPIVVTFKVFPSGKIEDVKIADSAGNELLASKIRVSIQNTTLDKFPDYVTDKYIDVKFSYFFF